MATKGKINVDFTMRFIGALRSNRIVANPNRYSTIAYKDVVHYAARAAHVPDSSVEVAMDALYDALSYFVLNGHNVKIDGLGTFSFGVNAKAEVSAASAGADAVRRLKIDYLPEKDLREAMNNVAVTTTYSNPGNLAIDTSVPAHVEEVGWMPSQASRDVHNVVFGDTVNVPEGGLYLRVLGSRMDRLTSATARFTFLATNSEEAADSGYRDTLEELPLEIIAQSAKVAIIRVNIPVMSDYPAQYSLSDFQLLSLKLNSQSTNVLFWYFTTASTGSVHVRSAHILSYWQDNRNYNMTRIKGSELAVPFGYAYALFVQGSGLSKMNTTLMAGLFGDISAVQIEEVTMVSDKKLEFRFRPLQNVLSFDPLGGYEFMDSCELSFGGSSSEPVVTSLTANGISVANGGSSTVTAGSSYNFAFAGRNLANTVEADIVVPQGCTISNFSASDTLVSFTMGNAAAGTIGLKHNNQTLFSVTVTVPTNISASVTSIGNVSNNGTYDASSITHPRLVLDVVGTGLNTLTAANFVPSFSGLQCSLNEGSATARQLTISGDAMSDFVLRVQVNDTTLFTLNVSTGGGVIS